MHLLQLMPVLDWARTDLSHDNPNGANNLYMNWGEFAYFDIYILQREGAREDWAEFSKEHKWGRDLVAEADEIKKDFYTRAGSCPGREYHHQDPGFRIG